MFKEHVLVYNCGSQNIWKGQRIVINSSSKFSYRNHQFFKVCWKITRIDNSLILSGHEEWISYLFENWNLVEWLMWVKKKLLTYKNMVGSNVFFQLCKMGNLATHFNCWITQLNYFWWHGTDLAIFFHWIIVQMAIKISNYP